MIGTLVLEPFSFQSVGWLLRMHWGTPVQDTPLPTSRSTSSTANCIRSLMGFFSTHCFVPAPKSVERPSDPGMEPTPVRCHGGSPQLLHHNNWAVAPFEPKPWTWEPRRNARHGTVSSRRGRARTKRETAAVASQGNSTGKTVGNGHRSGVQSRPESYDACWICPNVSPLFQPTKTSRERPNCD